MSLGPQVVTLVIAQRRPLSKQHGILDARAAPTFAPIRRAAPSVQRSPALPSVLPFPPCTLGPVDPLPMARNAGKFGIVSRRRKGEAT